MENKTKPGTVKPIKIEKANIFMELPLYVMIAFMFIAYVVLHEVMFSMFAHADRQLFEHNFWDSYTYQALAWLDGKVDVENYSWLEIARYDGRYFVSFPPLPSLVMLPFALIFGADTPNNLLIAIYAIITACFAYASLRKIKMNSWLAAFCAMFFVFGSNMLFISTMGGVWFQAQMLAVLFLMCMIYAAQCNKRVLAYAMVALAVGCRPFSVVAVLPLFVYFTERDISEGVFETKRGIAPKKMFKYILEQCKYLIIPLCIGLVYMWYNYIRFDNPFQFGHDYLPEFINSPDGQFNISYISGNLYKLLVYFPEITASGFNFPMFNGFIFYIANPFFLIVIIKVIIDCLKKRFDVLDILDMAAMFLSLLFFVLEHKQGASEPTVLLTLALVFALLAVVLFFVKAALDIFVKKRVGMMRLVLVFAMYVMLVFTCYHKTLGGWQFGARYTVDFLPLAFFYMLLDGEWKLKWYEYVIAVFAIAFNVYGAIMGQI
ncbi:MAG: hypothetical protein IJO48_05415 [Clostridia bacterium]|nr:hypothetical protein [Clostridia bacterium]